MMNDSKGTVRPNLRPGSERLESAFGALPPLGTPEYVAYILTANSEALPPEVLARAFRQLPAVSEASKATLERLFRLRPDGKWDYVGLMVSRARRQYGANDYEDRVQDALKRILQVLPAPRGEFAERAWNSFCLRELADARRERFGRRNERHPNEISLEDETGGDVLPKGLKALFPQFYVDPSQAELIEETALRVLSEIPDEFVSAVAAKAWFQDERPKHSGLKGLSASGSLTSLFPEKSRFQIMRAARYADAQLAGALLDEPMLVLDREWQGELEELRAKAPGLARSSKGKIL